MNILNKVTLQNLKKNRTRTIVTIIGVILSVSMITAVTSFAASLQSFLIKSVIENSGDWHVVYNNSDTTFAQKIAENKDVKTVSTVQRITYASYDGLNPQSTPPPPPPSNPYLFVLGFDSNAMKTMPIHLTQGRAPQNSSEIIIPNNLVTAQGTLYKTGDKIALNMGNRISSNNNILSTEDDLSEGESFVTKETKLYNIVGICKFSIGQNVAGSSSYLITASEQNAAAAKNVSVCVTMHSPSKVYDFAKITNVKGYKFNNYLLYMYGVSDNESSLSGLKETLIFLAGILIAIIMVGSVLMICNSFAISINERSKQFGILSSVGATRKQLRKCVLFEGLCIGATGIPLGIIAGVGGIGIVLEFVKHLFKDLVNLSVVISFPALIVAAIIGALTILISAYIPAFKAMRKSAIDVIRQSDDIKIRAKEVKTGKLTRFLFGLEGTLAMKNFKRNKKRYRSTVISLFVSLVLFISASSFGTYLKATASNALRTPPCNILFSANEKKINLSNEQLFRLYSQMKTASGITDSQYYKNIPCYSSIPKEYFNTRYLEAINGGNIDYPFQKNNKDSTDFHICFLNDDVYNKYLQDLGLSRNDYGIAKAKLPAIAKLNMRDPKTKRIISVEIFNRNNLELDVNFGYEGGKTAYAPSQKIAASLSDKAPKGLSGKELGYFGSDFSFIMYAPYSEAHLLNANEDAFDSLNFQFWSSDSVKSAQEMKPMIKEYEVNSDYYQLYNFDEALKQENNMLLVVNIFIYGFVILISLITIANVFNTISTGINLRKREFAVLRSIGMQEGSFSKMMNFECIFFGLKSLLYGLPVSGIITFLIYKSVTHSMDVPFTLPWLSIGLSVFSIFFVVFVTMLYATNKLKKINIIDSLRVEV